MSLRFRQLTFHFSVGGLLLCSLLLPLCRPALSFRTVLPSSRTEALVSSPQNGCAPPRGTRGLVLTEEGEGCAFAEITLFCIKIFLFKNKHKGLWTQLSGQCSSCGRVLLCTPWLGTAEICLSPPLKGWDLKACIAMSGQWLEFFPSTHGVMDLIPKRAHMEHGGTCLSFHGSGGGGLRMKNRNWLLNVVMGASRSAFRLAQPSS